MPNHVFQVTIAILEISPLIWRRILVPEEFTFYEFHVAIQDAMGWKHLQPYVFSGLTNAPGLKICRPQSVGKAPLSTVDYKIREFFTQPGDGAIYVYDSMMHSIKLECIHQRTQVLPVCIGGGRACPPDGVGGTLLYERFLMIMNDQHDLDRDTLKAWLIAIGGPLNPEYFDSKSIVFSDAQTLFLTEQT